MTKSKAQRKFLKIKNKTRKNKTRRNKKRYNGGDINEKKIFYVYDNPLLKDKPLLKDAKYDKSTLHKFIVKQYNKMEIGDLKEFLHNIDEKLALIKYGRKKPNIQSTKSLFAVQNFINNDESNDKPTAVTGVTRDSS